MIYTVSLEQLEFKANHGLYAYEKLNGNSFQLSITLEKSLPDDYIFSDIESTIDYEIISKIASEHMAKPLDLLEQVIHNMGAQIKESFENISTLKIKLAKSNPPIGVACKESVVSLHYDFKK